MPSLETSRLSRSVCHPRKSVAVYYYYPESGAHVYDQIYARMHPVLSSGIQVNNAQTKSTVYFPSPSIRSKDIQKLQTPSKFFPNLLSGGGHRPLGIRYIKQSCQGANELAQCEAAKTRHWTTYLLYSSHRDVNASDYTVASLLTDSNASLSALRGLRRTGAGLDTASGVVRTASHVCVCVVCFVRRKRDSSRLATLLKESKD